MTIEERVDTLEDAAMNRHSAEKCASHGVGTAGVTLGTIGTALGTLNLLGNNGGSLLNKVTGSGTNGDAAIGAALGAISANMVNGQKGTCNEDHLVNRYEFNLMLDNARAMQEKDLKIASLESEKISDKKDVELYKQIKEEMNARNSAVDARLTMIEQKCCDQAVYNATNTATISCLANQVNGIQQVLNGLTKTVIPNSSICPGWGNVSINPTTA